jgi:hypothetical protein
LKNSSLRLLGRTDFVQDAKVTPGTDFNRVQILKRQCFTTFRLLYFVQLFFRNIWLSAENQPISLVYFYSFFEYHQLSSVFFNQHLILGKLYLLVFSFIFNSPKLPLFSIQKSPFSLELSLLFFIQFFYPLQSFLSLLLLRRSIFSSLFSSLLTPLLFLLLLSFPHFRPRHLFTQIFSILKLCVLKLYRISEKIRISFFQNFPFLRQVIDSYYVQVN